MGLWTRNWRVWVFIHLRVGPLIYKTGLCNRKWLCQRCLFILYTSMKIGQWCLPHRFFQGFPFRSWAFFVVIVVVVFHISREDQSWLLFVEFWLFDFFPRSSWNKMQYLNYPELPKTKKNTVISSVMWKGVQSSHTMPPIFCVQWRGALVWGEL